MYTCTCEETRAQTAVKAECAAAPTPEEFETNIYCDVETGRRIQVVGEPREFQLYETRMMPFPSAKTFAEKVYPIIRETGHGWDYSIGNVEMITGTKLAADYERLTWPRHG